MTEATATEQTVKTSDIEWSQTYPRDCAHGVEIGTACADDPSRGERIFAWIHLNLLGELVVVYELRVREGDEDYATRGFAEAYRGDNLEEVIQAAADIRVGREDFWMDQNKAELITRIANFDLPRKRNVLDALGITIGE